MGSRWYKRHWKRLKAEEIIMTERFPQFVLKGNRKQLFWEGILMTNFETHYKVKIVYPINYPYQRPAFRVEWPRIIKGAPHIYADGSLCVYPDHWNYKRCTAPAGVPLVSSWLAMYEIWLRTRKKW
jgi:ubiquitin-protein ligase